MIPSACPICGLGGGFHDSDDENGKHAATRARIPAELLKPTSTSQREVWRAERLAAYEAWKAEQSRTLT